MTIRILGYINIGVFLLSGIFLFLSMSNEILRLPFWILLIIGFVLAIVNWTIKDIKETKKDEDIF